MPRFELSDSLLLRPLESDDAIELHDLIECNRAYLARWLPWAAGQTLEGTHEFIQSTVAQENKGDGFQVALVADGLIAGVLGCDVIDQTNRIATLGY